jgi:hypothetical protein
MIDLNSYPQNTYPQHDNNPPFFIKIGFSIDGKMQYIDTKLLQDAATTDLKNMAFIDVLRQLTRENNGN